MASEGSYTDTKDIPNNDYCYVYKMWRLTKPYQGTFCFRKCVCINHNTSPTTTAKVDKLLLNRDFITGLTGSINSVIYLWRQFLQFDGAVLDGYSLSVGITPIQRYLLILLFMAT